MRPTEKSEIKKYRLVAILFLGIGIILLSGSVWAFCTNAKSPISHLIIGILGVMSLSLGSRQLLSLSKGAVVFSGKQAISLRLGEFTFDEPMGPYTVWIFCDTPFSRYYGSICITRLSTGQKQIIKIPRRSVWLWWWWRPRADVSPVIWKSPQEWAYTQTRCSIKFDLVPTFAGSVFDEMYPTHDVESLTVLIKTARRRSA
jgi:hypothetical protein